MIVKYTVALIDITIIIKARIIIIMMMLKYMAQNEIFIIRTKIKRECN